MIDENAIKLEIIFLYIDIFINFLFFLEALLKIISIGFIRGKTSYLRDN